MNEDMYWKEDMEWAAIENAKEQYKPMVEALKEILKIAEDGFVIGSYTDEIFNVACHRLTKIEEIAKKALNG